MSLSPARLNSDLPAAHEEQSVKVGEVPQESDPLKKDHSTTPPSSPPVYSRQRTMATDSQDMPPPTAPASKLARKRSRGEEATVTIDSSANVVDDFDPLASQDQEDATDFTAANMPNVQRQRLLKSSRPAPTSAQGGGQQHPKQPQQEPRIEDNQLDSEMTTASNDPGLPEDQLEDLDWSEMESRYHSKMTVLQDREKENFQELNNLIAFFAIWAEVGRRKEDDRGYKRLKTQMAYVQHEESELEKKRLHYIKVVDAFKTVGVMLKEPNWAQSFIPDHASLSRVRRSILKRVAPKNGASTRPLKRKRDSRTTPLIKVEEWAVRAVDDVDMRRFGCRDRHVARCVIL